MRILVKGGTVVTASGPVAADVLVDGERITALAAPGTDVADAWLADADKVINAAGKYVLPGGIDVHTHMEMPFGGTVSSDTSKQGPAPRRGAAPPRSSTSPCRPREHRCLPRWTSGTPRRTATASSTTGST